MIWVGRIFLVWMTICTTLLIVWVVATEVGDARERRAQQARDEYRERDAA